MLTKTSLLCLETNSILRWELIFNRSAVSHTPQERKQNSEFYRLRKHLRRNPEEFYDYFHMSLEAYNYIFKHVKERLNASTATIKNLTAEEKLFITLRYLSSGQTFKELSRNFLIGCSTASKTVANTLTVLRETFQSKHLAPKRRQDIPALAGQFFHRWRFPNCIGAIGGKFIALHKKKSWKKNPNSCIILYATSDAEFRFQTITTNRTTDEIDYTFEGSFSNLGGAITPDENIKLPYVLIGNKAFPLKKNLLRPYPEESSYQREIFNKRLEKARFTIDAAFEILLVKWHLLRRPLELQFEYASTAIQVCCLIHNIIKDIDGIKDRDFKNYSMLDTEPVFQNMVTKLSRKNNRASSFAIQIRDRFGEYLMMHE